jgi:hypothetical protein
MMKLLLILTLCALHQTAFAAPLEVVIVKHPPVRTGNFAFQGGGEDPYNPRPRRYPVSKPYTPPPKVDPGPAPAPMVAAEDILANPYRTVGTNLFNLGYLLKWNRTEAIRYQDAAAGNKEFIPTARPLSAWQSYSGQVERILPDAVLLREPGEVTAAGFSKPGATYCVRNFPAASQDLVGKHVNFYALPVGDSHETGVPLLDYGVPAKPATKSK